MVEWIPWLLIIIGWHPDTPEDQRVVRVQWVADQEECDLLGDEFVESRKIYREELGPHQYRYFCSPAPDRESLDDAWRSRMEQQTEAQPGQ